MCSSLFGQFSHHDLQVTLAVGSPTLAAFSLALTAVNARWANNRFSAIKYPNHESAVKILIHLQQVPLHLTTRDGLLASLVVLPENDGWWECLVNGLEQTHTWTIATGTSIAWVIIAFVFTIIDSFVDVEKNLYSNGRDVGTLWLWLVPIVVGWLWAPVCSYDKLKAAIDMANDIALVAAPDSPPQPDVLGDSSCADGSRDTNSPRRTYDILHIAAIRISERNKVFIRDAARTAPVFNFARAWDWWPFVETIARAFEHADENVEKHVAVDSRKWILSEDKHIAVHRDNRTGTLRQVQAYCGLPALGGKEAVQPAPSGIWKRVLIAAVFALGLQWGTTGSATMMEMLAPTTGLGCRSGAYILYGIISTTIWLALLLSSYLSHFAKMRYDHGHPRRGISYVTVAEGLATFLRRLSIVVAGCNTIGVILICMFQFSNFYSTCYCNSSVLGRGVQHAYDIIFSYGHVHIRAAWIWGFVLSGGCAIVYLFFLGLMLERSHHTKNR